MALMLLLKSDMNRLLHRNAFALIALCIISFTACSALESDATSKHNASTQTTASESGVTSTPTPTPSATPSPTPIATPTPPPVDGWTEFTPSADTNVIYVSQSGVYNCVAHAASTIPDPFHPPTDIGTCRTPEEAQDLARHGYPDWVLFKRGDVWMRPLGHWMKFGRSPTEMFLLGAYGDETLDRPTFKTGLQGGLYTGGGGGSPSTFNDFALVGLAFYANGRDTRSPDYQGPGDKYGSQGYVNLLPGRNLLVEDCLFSNYTVNVILEVGGDSVINDVRFRRNVVVDAWALECNDDNNQGHAQGLFTAHIHGLLIEENVFDHNGWNDNPNLKNNCWSGQTWFNHNMYLSQGDDANLIVRGNITSRAAHHGLQLRPGGIAEDNLFANDPLAMFTGHSDSVVRKNVILGGSDLVQWGERLGRGWGIDVLPANNTLVEENIVAHKNPGVEQAYSHAYAIGRSDFSVPTYNVNFQKNIAYNWKSPSLTVLTLGSVSPAPTSLRITDNSFQEPNMPYQIVDFDDPAAAYPHVFSANRYFTGAVPAHWFEVYDPTYTVRYADFADWSGWIGESGAVTDLVTSYPDPNRTIETYQTSIGGTASFDAFIARARQQRRGNYWMEYTAGAVNNYIRAGFGR